METPGTDNIKDDMDEKELPVVSIVVPAYNHENYVVDCIKSILEQDYPNIELIVINDGSTDSTGEKIRDYIRKNGESFRFISKENEGLVKTLNLGLKSAKGKYFCELASDDMLLPGSIRKRVEHLEANPDIEAVFADGYSLDGVTPTTKHLLGGGNRAYDSRTHTIKDLVGFTRKGKVIVFPTGMIKKSVLDELGGFDEDFRFYEDIDMEYRLALRGRVGFINEPVMYLRRHSTNVSKVYTLKTREEKILVLKKLFLLVETSSLKKLIRTQLSKQYWKYYKVGKKYGVDKAKLETVLKNAIKMRPLHYKTLRCLYYLMMNRFGA
ncbi:MAG: glycosyltransferase family A protein [Thermodesulfobacteriota bacterium]